MARNLQGLLLGAGMVLGLVMAVQSVGFTIPVTTGNFSHKTHADKGFGDCSSCHGSSTDGTVEAPGANHEPCNTCHAEEFRKADSQLCYGCHVSNKPWTADSPVKSLSGGASDFIAGFSHKDHKDRIGGMKGGDCASCHPTQSGKAAPAPPAPRRGQRGILPAAHKLCSTCHTNLKPTMSDCAGCHVLPKTAAEGARLAWRVGAKFTHDNHVGALKQSCSKCHGEVLDAPSGKPIPRPTMKFCGDSCHNGKIAFKTTGHSCTNCHGPTTGD